MFVFNFIFLKLHIYRFTELSNLASFGSLLCRFLHVYCLEFCVSDVFLVFYLFHYFIFFLVFFGTAIQTRLQMAMEVKDSLEITHTGEYLNFLKCYFRAFSVILYNVTKPQFTDNPEHKLRNIVVEILNRLPHSEVLRPFVQELLKVAMHVLTTDNEENGLICIRIIFDLLRNFRPTLENEVQPFLDFVCKIYQNFRATVSYFFESGVVPTPPPPASGAVSSALSGDDVKPMEVSDQVGPPSGHVVQGLLNPSTRSFKVVTESPLVVMFLFQLYSRLVQTNIPHLLPLMVSAISVPGPDKIPPYLRNHFTELKGAQVKVCLSLLILFSVITLNSFGATIFLLVLFLHSF